MDRPAPRTNNAELRFQFSVVARKIALRICGPATMTKAIGRSERKLTRREPDQALPSQQWCSHPSRRGVDALACGPPTCRGMPMTSTLAHALDQLGREYGSRFLLEPAPDHQLPQHPMRAVDA